MVINLLSGWLTDPLVIEKMNYLADDGDERYASGEGLQLTELKFPMDFDLKSWMKLNRIVVTTIEDLRNE